MLTPEVIEKSKAGELYNESLGPYPYDKRKVTPVGLGFIWFGMSITVSIFTSFAGFAQWLTIGQILVAAIIGFTICGIANVFVQEMGIIYGIPFISAMRASFGTAGSYFISLVKLPAPLFWTGFNSFLGGSAFNQISVLTIGFDNVYLFMGVFAALQILVIYKGASRYAKFNTIVTPLLLIMGAYIWYLLLRDNNVTIMQVLSMGGADGTPAEKTERYILCVMAAVGLWLGVNFATMNFTRECKTDPSLFKSWTKTNWKYGVAVWLGMAIPTTVVGVFGGMSFVLAGTPNPVDLISQTVGAHSVFIAIFCQIFVLFGILSTNTGANLYTGAFLLCNFFKKLEVKHMTIVVLIIATALRPWRTIGFLGPILTIFGRLSAPIGGIMITDYYFYRKRKFSMPDFYTKKGKYTYFKGLNPAAIISYIITMLVVHLPIFLKFASIVGVPVSGIFYYLGMKYWIEKKYPECKEDLLDHFI